LQVHQLSPVDQDLPDVSVGKTPLYSAVLNAYVWIEESRSKKLKNLWLDDQFLVVHIDPR